MRIGPILTAFLEKLGTQALVEQENRELLLRAFKPLGPRIGRFINLRQLLICTARFVKRCRAVPIRASIATTRVPLTDQNNRE